jgi:hypothetical protein
MRASGAGLAHAAVVHRRFAVSAVLTIALLGALAPAPAFAASAAKPLPSATTSSSTGIDVSWPQCGRTLPSGRAFGVVGVNGGTASTFSPCVASEAAWARTTTGSTGQPRLAFYINTANPYGQGSWWPTSDSSRPPAGTAPYPTGALPVATVTYPTSGAPIGCTTTATGTPSYNSRCAYVYGYVRAEQAVEWTREQIGSFDPAAYRWWLDVETTNTWQTDTASNSASLAGAAAYLQQAGLGVGVYSTTAQWTTIVGGTNLHIPPLPNGAKSNLIGLDEWGAGASSQKGAQSNCTAATPFTGGTNRLMQYLSSGTDYDVSCSGY